MPKQKLIKAARLALLAVAMLYILLYLLVAIRHMAYPYELEWMEGGIADHVQRLAGGEQIYVKPSLDFIPYTYTPLYFYACIPAVKLLGMSFMPLRLVSLLASIVCMFLIVLIVRRETRSLYSGIIAAAFYAAAYQVCGGWYDLARPDSLFMMFLLAAVFLLRSGTPTAVTVAAVAALLAFLTKQTALFVGAGMCLYSLTALKGLRRLIFPLIFAGGIVWSTTLFNHFTDGWYSYYIFHLPSHHTIVPYRVVSFWLFDIGSKAAIAASISTFAIIALYRNGHGRKSWFYLAILGSMVASAWLVRMRTGSYTNTLIPGYTALALGLGIGFSYLFSIASEIADSETIDDHTRSNTVSWRDWAPYAVLLLILAQFLALMYDPQKLLPSEADRAAGDKLISLMESVDGSVFLPGHGFLPALAGKKSYAHRVALRDILRDENGSATQSLRDEIDQRISDAEFDIIITDDKSWFTNSIMRAYQQSGTVFDLPDVFYPVTGRPIRPLSVFVPKTTQKRASCKTTETSAKRASQ